MLKSFDKAEWQIDGGIPEDLVVNHFNLVFAWLDKHKMLSDEGKEEYEFGIDSEALLNEELLTQDGIKFLDECYDEFLALISKDMYGKVDSIGELNRLYEKFKTENIINIELIPLEKMIYDGKEICLGAKKEDVIELLGNPNEVYERRHHYSEFACDYDENDELEAIEFLYGHGGELKPYIYGVSAFDVSKNDLLEILKEHNNGEFDEESEDSYGFINISVGVWKDSANEEDDHWTSILVGKKGYYM